MHTRRCFTHIVDSIVYVCLRRDFCSIFSVDFSMAGTRVGVECPAFYARLVKKQGKLRAS